jgi:hypothetical protein
VVVELLLLCQGTLQQQQQEAASIDNWLLTGPVLDHVAGCPRFDLSMQAPHSAWQLQLWQQQQLWQPRHSVTCWLQQQQ